MGQVTRACLNLISEFSWLIDGRDWDGLGQMFGSMEYTASGTDTVVSGSAAVSRYYHEAVDTANARWLHAQGSDEDPSVVRTRHLFSNYVIQNSDTASRISVRYYGTVIAASPEYSAQVRYLGRYYDVFALDDGRCSLATRHQEHRMMGWDNAQPAVFGTTV